MDIYNKDILGAVILIVFTSLGLVGTASYFWNVWFTVEKLRHDIKKDFQKQSWAPTAFNKWRFKFIETKLWLWCARTLITIVVIFLSSLFALGIVLFFISITENV